jgi:O-antigen ligase
LWIIAILFLLTAMIRADLLENIVNYVLRTYKERATLTSDNGRVTIWLDNAVQLLKQNKLLFGVGQNQIQHLTTTGLECHNTWLEWICGAGLVAGGAAIYWFLSVPYIMWRKARGAVQGMHSFLPLLFAYCAICICITTVDNITNSSLIFLAIIFGMGNLQTSEL